MKLWTRGSFARAILVAFLIISIAPLLFIAPLFISQSTTALTEQMEVNLEQLVNARAEEINLRLTKVSDTTEIAAQQAAYVLEQQVEPADLESRIVRYRPDGRNILGLDVYYQEVGGEAALGTDLSNVYWNNERPLNDQGVHDIITTEALDPVFEGIKSVSPETQWIYMTTTDGMMRLYPWASNDHYPDGWDPREIIFYTVADPSNNPDMVTQWTPPYVDFAGAGWMVTVSTPIMGENSEFLGIMSHDITINSLKEIALDISVLDGAGYGFLIDKEGNVVAHPAYEDADATEGTQETVNLLNTGTEEYQGLIRQMAAGESGLSSYEDENSETQILVYAPIPAIGWSLGIVVPQNDVVSSATVMRSRTLGALVFLVAAAAMAAFLLTRRIHRPIKRLLVGVNQLSEDRQADEINIQSFIEFRDLAKGFNEMAARVWEREMNLKKTVASLRIEIDSQRSQKQVEALSETEYFQYLENNAERIRRSVRGETLPEEDMPVVDGKV